MSNRWKGGFIQAYFDPLTPGEFAPQPLYSWGDNGAVFSQAALGLNDTIDRSSPTQVGSGGTWLDVSGGQYCAGARKDLGSIFVWGYLSSGLSGNNTAGAASNTSSPIQVGALTDWAFFNVNQQSAGAIKTNGTLWTWGSANAGKLAQDTNVNVSSPIQVGSDTDWASAMMGQNAAFYIKTDGALYASGSSVYGELGINISGATARRSSPVQVGSQTWTDVQQAGNFSLGLQTNGTLWSWGRNNLGQLGKNDLISRSSPVQIGSLTNWTNIAVGKDGTCLAVNASGQLYSWGENIAGLLGQNNAINYSSPVQVGALNDWDKVEGGYCRAFLAIKTDGTLWAWGDNAQGQIGQDDISTGYSSPVQVGSEADWIDASPGRFSSYGIRG